MSQKRSETTLFDLLVLSGLWMLFGFTLWFYLSVFHLAPVHWFSERILGAILGDDLYNIIRLPEQRYIFQVQTRILFDYADGSRSPLGFLVNPLIYGYGLPMLFGLSMATDSTLRRKLGVVLAGYVAVAAVQIWGVVWASLSYMIFSFGGSAGEAVREAGLNPSVVALMNQMGNLILPAMVPVVVWVFGHRHFVARLAGRPLGGAG